jgi:hypothetical protein
MVLKVVCQLNSVLEHRVVFSTSIHRMCCLHNCVILFNYICYGYVMICHNIFLIITNKIIDIKDLKRNFIVNINTELKTSATGTLATLQCTQQFYPVINILYRFRTNL